jgi:probable phosphoglycerate mutase
MIAFATLRHASTAWNEAGLLQGRADIPLSAAGRAAIAACRLPPEFAGFDVLTSPLARCRETAAALGLGHAVVDDRLAEMDWGAYQGHTLAQLRATYGVDLAENEGRGLDFTPPQGESPRAVVARLEPLLAERARLGRPCLAVTHRGVVRALLSLATGWPMTGKPPVRFDWQGIQLFMIDALGRPRLERYDILLVARNGTEQ